MRKCAFLLLLLPTAAAAQQLDLGVTGGVRLSTTDWIPNSQISDASRLGVSIAPGLEMSYTFYGDKVRMSTGVAYGELVQAVRLRTAANAQNSAPALELHSAAWQLPLRLHYQLFDVGRDAHISLRNGLIWQLNSGRRPSTEGDYNTIPLAEGETVQQVQRTGNPGEVLSLYFPESRKKSGLLLETGVELNYAISNVLTFDTSLAYQAGLRRLDGWSAYRDVAAEPVITTSSKGSNVLITLGMRYTVAK